MATALAELDAKSEGRESDPTLRAVASLNDESQWQILRDVPVFTEHDEYDEDKDSPTYGKIKRHFGPEELQVIADNNNRRFTKTGDACPLTLGHTLPGRPEKDQPEIAGFALNFSVGQFGPSGKTTIKCDWYFYQDIDLDKTLRQFPRRSVELFPRDNIFDPIALLRRTPELDMGLTIDYAKRERAKLYKRMERLALRYHFQDWQVGQPCLRYGYEKGDDIMAPNELSTEDKAKAERYLKHHIKNDPVLRHAAEEIGASEEDDGGLSMKEQHYAKRFMAHYAKFGPMRHARRKFMAENKGDENLIKHYAAEADDEDLSPDEEEVAEKYWKHHYAKNPCIKYALGEEEEPNIPEEAGANVEAKPEPPAEGETAAAAPAAAPPTGDAGAGTEGGGELPPEHPLHDADGPLPPEHQYTAERYFKHAIRKHPAMYGMYMKQHAEHYAADGGGTAAAAPSATNVTVPGHEGEEGAGTPVPRKEEADQMSAKQEAIQHARQESGLAARVANLEKENQKQRGEIATLRYERDRAECEATVTQLEAEGVVLNRKEEVDIMAKLPAGERKTYEAKIRKCYQKAPISGDPSSLHIAEVGDEEAMARVRTGDSEHFGNKERAEAIAYHQDHPTESWADCVKKFTKKKTA